MSRFFAAFMTAAAVFLTLTLAAMLAGRALFNEPGAPRVDSARETLDADRVLFVFAHPDDEITSNALMRRLVEEGAHVALFTATRGENGTQAPPVVDQAHLGVVREAEARKHGFDIGVDRHVVADLGDGRLIERSFDELVEIVAGEIETARPDVVITFHPETAISMHPDHRTIGAAAVRAAQNSQLRPQIVYVLGPRPGLRRFGGDRGLNVAAGQPEPDFTISAPARDKLGAWRIHHSQSDYIPAAYGIPAWMLYAVWTEEYFSFAEIGLSGEE